MEPKGMGRQGLLVGMSVTLVTHTLFHIFRQNTLVLPTVLLVLRGEASLPPQWGP